MIRRTRALRPVVICLASTLFMTACPSWWDQFWNISNTAPDCKAGRSAAFSNIIGKAPTLQQRFAQCGIKLKRADTLNVIEEVRMQFDLNMNNNVGLNNSNFWLWTKNTYYANATPRGDVLQSSGVWVLTRASYVEWSPTHGANHSFEDFKVQLDFYVGYPISGTTKEKDSLHLWFDSNQSYTDATYGNNNGVYWKWFNVKRGVASGSVSNPSAVVGYPTTGSLTPTDDTVGYQTNWYWNGTIDSSAHNLFAFTRTPSLAGTYTLRADQILFDTTFTTTHSVVVPVNVTLNGSATVSNTVTNYYSATPSGGTSPYTYAWSIDGNAYSTSSSFAAPYWATYSDHWVEVTVTDANGATGFADIHVFVSSCDPEDPECQPELRASDAPKRTAPSKRPLGRTLTPTVRRP